MIYIALVVIRAIHFSAILLLEGTVVFRFVIAAPVLHNTEEVEHHFDRQRLFLSRTMALSLLFGILSGAAWLFVLAGQIVGSSPMHALMQGIDWKLLSRTQFGEVWKLRSVASFILALSLAVAARVKAIPLLAAATSIVLAVFLSGSLAWAGHGAATPGVIGDVHLVADILHLIAAGIWIGGLAPLAFFLLVTYHTGSTTCLAVAATITRKFSSLAVASVTLLLISGIVNSYVLVGSVSALFDTPYGRLLSLKIGLFIAILGFAAFNRILFTPRLAAGSVRANRSALSIGRNSIVELSLGIAVLLIVGILGTMPPANHGCHHSSNMATQKTPDVAYTAIPSKSGSPKS